MKNCRDAPCICDHRSAITNSFLIGIMPQLISKSIYCICVNIPVVLQVTMQSQLKYFHAWEWHGVSCMAVMHCYGHLCNQLDHLMHNYIIRHNTMVAIGWLPIWAIGGKVISLAYYVHLYLCFALKVTGPAHRYVH